MASFLVAVTYLTYNKIKTKREEKKEKKRKGYADRYSELERAQRRHDEEKVNLHSQSQSQSQPSSPVSPEGERWREREREKKPLGDDPFVGERRRSGSRESGRSEGDGPRDWVDDVVMRRGRGRGSGEEEVKRQSLI